MYCAEQHITASHCTTLRTTHHRIALHSTLHNAPLTPQDQYLPARSSFFFKSLCFSAKDFLDLSLIPLLWTTIMKGLFFRLSEFVVLAWGSILAFFIPNFLSGRPFLIDSSRSSFVCFLCLLMCSIFEGLRMSPWSSARSGEACLFPFLCCLPGQCQRYNTTSLLN